MMNAWMMKRWMDHGWMDRWMIDGRIDQLTHTCLFRVSSYDNDEQTSSVSCCISSDKNEERRVAQSIRARERQDHYGNGAAHRHTEGHTCIHTYTQRNACTSTHRVKDNNSIISWPLLLFDSPLMPFFYTCSFRPLRELKLK